MTEEKYITERLDNQISWYDKKSTYNRKCYQYLKIMEIIIAATIPFLIAQFKDDASLSLIAAILSICIAIIASLLITFKFNEKWIQYRATCESLGHEKYLFLTKSGIYNSPDSFPVFVQRAELIMSKENADWTQLVVATAENKGKLPVNEGQPGDDGNAGPATQDQQEEIK